MRYEASLSGTPRVRLYIIASTLRKHLAIPLAGLTITCACVRAVTHARDDDRVRLEPAPPTRGKGTEGAGGGVRKCGNEREEEAVAVVD